MKSTTLNVPGISCGHCKNSIEGALTGQTGIASVIVHIDNKIVDIMYDENKTSIKNIEALIEDQGYDIAR